MTGRSRSARMVGTWACLTCAALNGADLAGVLLPGADLPVRLEVSTKQKQLTTIITWLQK